MDDVDRPAHPPRTEPDEAPEVPLAARAPPGNMVRGVLFGGVVVVVVLALAGTWQVAAAAALLVVSAAALQHMARPRARRAP